jgi:hypothetical protein
MGKPQEEERCPSGLEREWVFAADCLGRLLERRTAQTKQERARPGADDVDSVDPEDAWVETRETQFVKELTSPPGSNRAQGIQGLYFDPDAHRRQKDIRIRCADRQSAALIVIRPAFTCDHTA